MDQLDRDRKLPGRRSEARAELGREGDADRSQMLAAEIEQVLGAPVGGGRLAWQLSDEGLELGQVAADPVLQLA